MQCIHSLLSTLTPESSSGGGKQMVDLSHLLLGGGINTHNPPLSQPLIKPHWPKAWRVKRLALPCTTMFHLAGKGRVEGFASCRVPQKSGRVGVSEILTSPAHNLTHSHCYHPTSIWRWKSKVTVPFYTSSFSHIATTWGWVLSSSLMSCGGRSEGLINLPHTASLTSTAAGWGYRFSSLLDITYSTTLG